MLATIAAALLAAPGLGQAAGLLGALDPGDRAAAVGAALTQGCSMQFRAATVGAASAVQVGGVILAGPGAGLPLYPGPADGAALGGPDPLGFYTGLARMGPARPMGLPLLHGGLGSPDLGGLGLRGLGSAGPGTAVLAPAVGEPAMFTRVAGAETPGCAVLRELGHGPFPGVGLAGFGRVGGLGGPGFLDDPFEFGF